MKYIHVNNLMDHHPKYRDRDVKWVKVFTSMLDLDPAYAFLHELDKWRLIAFIIIEIETSKEVPLNTDWLEKKGFDFSVRSLEDTLSGIKELVEVREVQEKGGVVKVKKKAPAVMDDDKEKDVISIFNHWNSFKIIVHRDKVKYYSTIHGKLALYSVDEIKNAISNYAYVLLEDKFYWTWRWSLDQFLNRKNGLDRFLDINFKASDFKKGTKEEDALKKLENFENE